MKTILAACVAAAVLAALAGCGVPVAGTGDGSTAAPGPEQPPGSEKALTSFSILTPAVCGALDQDAYAVEVVVPSGTDRSSLVAVFQSTGVSVTVDDTEQESGISINDFTEPVTYVVHAEDGSCAEYAVTVERLPSVEKSITSFGFKDLPTFSAIDQEARVIRVRVPPGSVVTGLAAVFTMTGVSVSVNGVRQESGVTVNDYSSPVACTVRAEDGSSAVYQVRVTGTIGLLVNELDVDQPGTDTAEYVELYASAEVDLFELALIFFNGSVSPGQEYARVDLGPAGVLVPGCRLVVAGPAVAVQASAAQLTPPGWELSNRIQNGPLDAVMVYDLLGHRVVDTVSYSGVLHAAVISGEAAAVDATEGSAGAPADTGSGPGSICRSPDGQDSGQNGADFRFSPAPTPGAPNL